MNNTGEIVNCNNATDITSTEKYSTGNAFQERKKRKFSSSLAPLARTTILSYLDMHGAATVCRYSLLCIPLPHKGTWGTV